MTREDKIEITRRFNEWIERTAGLYLTERNDVLSVIKCVLSEIDKAESEEEKYGFFNRIQKM